MTGRNYCFTCSCDVYVMEQLNLTTRVQMRNLIFVSLGLMLDNFILLPITY